MFKNSVAPDEQRTNFLIMALFWIFVVICVCLLIFVITFPTYAQSNNYIEVDGKRTYLESMTPQEIKEDKKSVRKTETPIVVNPPAKETTVIVIPQGPQVNSLIDPIQPRNYQPYSNTVKVKITNKRSHDKEYFESTGKGTLKKVEIDKGKKVEEQWKMENGIMVKERKVVK